MQIGNIIHRRESMQNHQPPYLIGWLDPNGDVVVINANNLSNPNHYSIPRHAIWPQQSTIDEFDVCDLCTSKYTSDVDKEYCWNGSSYVPRWW